MSMSDEQHCAAGEAHNVFITTQEPLFSRCSQDQTGVQMAVHANNIFQLIEVLK